MSYVTPVKNHSAASYFNVADWTRIYGNAQLTNNLVAAKLSKAILFNTIATPTTSTNPSSILSMVDTLCANLERTRLEMVALIPTLTEIKDDWVAGPAEVAPDYSHVNQWETEIDAMWDYYNGDDLEVDYILTGDLIVPTATQAIYINSIDTDTYNIYIEGTGQLYII